jgi:iron complex outermembrane receptor protein
LAPLLFGLILTTGGRPTFASEPSDDVSEQAPTPPRSVQAGKTTDPAGPRETSGAIQHSRSFPDRQRVEEIVVRARKREELLEDTPISITALSANALRNAGITTIDQIQDLVPNLTFFTGRTGDFTKVRIRGIGPLELGDPGVGIYVDGVYMPRGMGSVLNVVDVEQIEVLRGPQGTLFGKNTVGGAITIHTVQPDENLRAFTMIRGGSFSTIETRTTMNIPLEIGPLTDKVFSRFSFATSNVGGYTKNRLRDEYWSDTESLWFLGSLRFVPTDDIEVNVSGNYFQRHSRGKGGECRVELEEPPDPAVAALMEQEYPEFQDACRASDTYKFKADAHSLSTPSDYGIWGHAKWDLGEVGFLDDLNLKVLGSWREQSIRFREDIDMTEVPLVQVSALGGSDPFDGRPVDSQAYNAEGQVNGAAFDDRLVFVTGIFGQWENRRSGLATRALAGTIADFFNATTIEDTKQNDWDWAIFGQATGKLTDWLSLTAGLRFTEEKKGIARSIVNPFGTATAPNEPIVLLDDSDAKKFTAWTPMASLAATVPEDLLGDGPIDHFMGYFTYGRGFKGGGFNAAVAASRNIAQEVQPYDPEFLDSFEIGFKTSAFDNRVTLNTAFFYGDYSDIQVVTNMVIPGPNPGDLPTTERVIQNAAKATLQGIEAEMFSRPIDNMQLSVAIGLLDPIYDDYLGFSDLDGTDLQRDGESFNDVPKFTSTVTLQYAFELGDGLPERMQGWLTPRLDWYYQSKAHITAGPELKTATQNGYNLLHFRTSYDFWDDRVQLAFFIRNLTDQAYFREVQPLTNPFGFNVRYFEPPRTYGGELSVYWS